MTSDVVGCTVQQEEKKNKNIISSAYPSSSSLHWTEKSIPGLTITTAFAIWLLITTVLIPALIQKYYYYCNNGDDDSSTSNCTNNGGLLPLPPINVLGWSILFFNNLNVLIARKQ